MSSEQILDPVASGPDLSRLWYADPTGETAVRNLMASTKSDDFAVVDSRGNVLFRIKPNVLAALLPALHFTLTRRGRSTIRAHKKNAPAAGCHQREGEDINP
jgi:hypothetical protein